MQPASLVVLDLTILNLAAGALEAGDTITQPRDTTKSRDILSASTMPVRFLPTLTSQFWLRMRLTSVVVTNPCDLLLQLLTPRSRRLN